MRRTDRQRARAREKDTEINGGQKKTERKIIDKKIRMYREREERERAKEGGIEIDTYIERKKAKSKERERER